MKPSHLLWIPLALALWSCAAPKASVVEETVAPVKHAAAAEQAESAPMPPTEDDGIRLPDMLTLPDEGEFRAGVPKQPAPGSNPGAVIARPPTDPPPRPKPEAGE